MKFHKVWNVLRPAVSVAVAVATWIGAMLLTSLFPETNAGKFLSDRGFCIGGGIFLLLLLLVVFFARFRWWESLLPVIVPLWIVGFDLTNYWTGRVWLFFILPIIISAGFAALLRHRQKLA